MSGLGGIMGGGGPMAMINQIMQMLQQMQKQQGGECGQAAGCDQGGQKDPAQMFQHVLQQLMQGQGQG